MKRVEKKDLFAYSFLSELTLSPNGEKLAFVVSQCQEDTNSYAKNIWLYEKKTGSMHAMTTRGDGKGISWLNVETLLFTAMRDEADKKKLQEGEQFTVFYALPVNGGEAYEYMRVPVSAAKAIKLTEEDFLITGLYDGRMTNLNGLDGDARKEAAAAVKEEKGYEIYDELPFWFNGAGVVNKKRNRLFRFRKEEGVWKLTPVTEALAEAGSVIYRNGLVYYTTETYQDVKYGKQAVWKYDPATEKSECLLEQGEFSIDGLEVLGDKILLFATDGKEYASTESADIFWLKEDGTTEKWVELDDGFGNGIGTDCHYGSSKQTLVTETGLYGLITWHTGVRLIRVTAEGQKEVIFDGPETLDGIESIPGSDAFYATAMCKDRLQELYLIKDGKAERISGFHDAYLAETEISVPEICNAEGAAGLIEGFVIRPVGYEAGKKYPAILDIHGGPRAAYGSVFFHEMQYWAAQGYFVFFCNPRGGHGRGDEFADIRGQYGVWDYEDIMAFTDHVLEEYPDIDAARIGVTGGSYGGYMTNWIVGQTDRFAAAAAQRSISNWLTKILSTDIGYLYNMDQQGAKPWENPEKLWEHSPLKYVAKVKTPLLFVQSDQDYRCWQAEAIQYFTALKLLGVETAICLIHGENHGLSRGGRPEQRLRRLTALTDWMDKYLKK